MTADRSGRDALPRIGSVAIGHADVVLNFVIRMRPGVVRSKASAATSLSNSGPPGNNVAHQYFTWGMAMRPGTPMDPGS